MKYIILILVAGLIIFVKPWRMSLEESIFSPAEDTTLLSNESLFPVHCLRGF